MSTSSKMTPAIDLADLAETTPQRVVVDDVPVCLVRFGDTVKAIHDVCSHQEWTLSDGLVFGNTVECDLHGSCFDLDTGRPMSLPALRPVPIYAVDIDGGKVLVDVTVAVNGAETPEH